MFRFIWILGVHVRNVFHRYAPTNILSDAIRFGRLGPMWALGAMLLAVPYFLAAYFCTVIIDGGGPRALYALVMLFIWDAMKMLWVGPVGRFFGAVSRRRGRQRRELSGRTSEVHDNMPTIGE